MAKTSKFKLPKSIAGLKVPKGLRKAEIVEGLLASPDGRRLLADALSAAGAAAAAVLEAGNTAMPGGSGAASAPDGPGPAAAQAAALVSAFLTEAASLLRPPVPAEDVATVLGPAAPTPRPAARRRRAGKAVDVSAGDPPSGGGAPAAG